MTMATGEDDNVGDGDGDGDSDGDRDGDGAGTRTTTTTTTNAKHRSSDRIKYVLLKNNGLVHHYYLSVRHKY